MILISNDQIASMIRERNLINYKTTPNFFLMHFNGKLQ